MVILWTNVNLLYIMKLAYYFKQWQFSYTFLCKTLFSWSGHMPWDHILNKHESDLHKVAFLQKLNFLQHWFFRILFKYPSYSYYPPIPICCWRKTWTLFEQTWVPISYGYFVVWLNMWTTMQPQWLTMNKVWSEKFT